MSRLDVCVEEEQIRKVIGCAFSESLKFQNKLKSELNLDNLNEISIEFYKVDEGGVSNTIYFVKLLPTTTTASAVTTSNQQRYSNKTQKIEFVLKLTSQKYKKTKTLNEVIVMKFLNENIPEVKCPEIYLYKTTNELIGYEFILMEKCYGLPLSDVFDTMCSLRERKSYIEQIVKMMGVLYSYQFIVKNGGNNYLFGPIEDIQLIDKEKKVIEVTVGIPFDTDRVEPYHSFNEYISSSYSNRLKELTNERFLKYKPFFESVEKYLGNSKIEMKASEYQLCHIDITPSNTIADPLTGFISGIIDWEWVSMTVIDEDINELFDNWTNNEEERIFMKECINREFSLLVSNEDNNEDNYWKRYEFRRIFYIARDHITRLVCYKDWFLGKPEEEAENFIQSVMKRIEVFIEENQPFFLTK
ncbi:hypothetical protein ABK040_003151 [Willaertia magna]